MTGILKNVPAESVRQSAKHVLFVEGADENSLDPQILSELLSPLPVSVKPLGPSFHIRSAAEALCKYHPTYYFLIDCDHYSDDEVAKSWKNFPDPQTANILIWPRRELENYFIIPEYLERSGSVTRTPEKLRECIRKHCKARLYLDVANQVIVSIREDFKKSWIKTFKTIQGFGSKDDALNKLKSLPNWMVKRESASHDLSLKEVEKRFQTALERFTGGNDNLEYGCGRWLEMISGKKVLNSVVTECCKIQDAQGKRLQGQDRLIEIAKDLLRKEICKQPADFQQLKTLIQGRMDQ